MPPETSSPTDSEFLRAFHATLKANGYQADTAQLCAAEALDEVYQQLCASQPATGIKERLRRWLPASWSDQRPPTGLYLWGYVGRGKTFTMDVFFTALPFDDKLRFHFHRLMYRVHNQLKELGGQTDPLEIIADDLARQARVICFDEFFVSEIGDAMILGKLLKGLFRRGVCLVATSNTPPAELYKGGLQRQQFMPAIELLEHHTRVLFVDGQQDYRLRVLEQAELWHAPLDTLAEENLQRYFSAIAPEEGSCDQTIEILGRDIPTRRRADGVVWFSFAALCDGPRSQDDYIEVAKAFQTVLLSEVPLLDRETENQARRFVALVDEFYERRVKLIVSAEHPIADIYQGHRLSHEFQRTISRLTEMQSHDYLAAAHKS